MAAADTFPAFPESTYLASHGIFNMKQAAASRAPAVTTRPVKSRPAPAVAAGWVLFDRAVPVAAQQIADWIPHAASAISFDGELRSFLTLRAPPDPSFAFLVKDLEEALDARNDVGWTRRKVVAADGNRILLEEPGFGCTRLVVFSVHQNQPCTLDVLPACQPARPSLGRTVGLVAKETKYAAAFMLVNRLDYDSPRACISCYTSDIDAWSRNVVVLPVIPDNPAFDWTTEASLSYRGCILWVDYERNGVLVYDFLSDDEGPQPAVLQPVVPTLLFMRLPPQRDRQAHLSSWQQRSLVVSEGTLKLVDLGGAEGDLHRDIDLWSLEHRGYVWIRQARLRVANCIPREPVYPVLNSLHASNLLFMMTSDLGLQDGQDGVASIESYDRTDLSLLGTSLTVLYDFGIVHCTPYVGSEISSHVDNPPEVPDAQGDAAYPLEVLWVQDAVYKVKQD